MFFYDENNKIINIDVIEKPEQDLVKKYILSYDTVLELLLLDFKNKQIKTNSSDFRHSIIENSTTVL